MQCANEVNVMETGAGKSISKGYTAVRDGGAGIIDLSARGRVRVGGSETARFLNGLVPNDVKTLMANPWMPALFPNVQGRLLAAVRVLNLGDHFLIDTEAATSHTVLNLLGRFTLAGDFQVTDKTEPLGSVSLQGKQATAILASIFG